jgi:translation initiation factor 2 subunit 1
LSISKEYPEEGDLVIATVKKVESYGAYVTLDEYEGEEGLLHISEIASTWIRNIKDYVREGQKLVLKVLRVNPEKGHIDLSLRRVTGREKTEKLLQWKKDKKAESIFKTAIEKLNKTEEEANNIKEVILGKYEGLYDAFEESVDEGEEAFIKLGVPLEWAKALTEAAKLKIKIEKAKVAATLELTCLKPNGVEAIKQSLINAEKVRKRKSASVIAYAIGAPKYRIEVLANNYEEAENLLEKAVNEALTTIKSLGGEGRQID